MAQARPQIGIGQTAPLAADGAPITVVAAGDVPDVFLIDATAAPQTVNLPAALTVGHRAIVQKTDATANGVDAAPSGSDVINGGSPNTRQITSQWDAISLMVAAVGKWVIGV